MWIVVWLIIKLWTFASLVKGDELQITPFHFPEEVNEKQQVQVTCGVKNHKDSIHFLWKKNGVPIKHGEKFAIHDISTVSLLMILTTSVEDSGNYTCIARRGISEDSYTAKLTVRGPPKWLKEPNDSVSAAAGDNVTLDCRAIASPKPSIKWARSNDNGATWFGVTDTQRITISSDGDTILFRDINISDAGDYRCEVTNGLGKNLQKIISLKVKDAPKIQPFYFPKNLTSGKNVKIICSSTEGTHPLTFEWYKDGTPVSHSSHMTIKSHGDYTLLNIDSVSWEDAGNYTCVISNGQGSDSHTAVLSVFASPIWTKEPQDTSVANGGVAVIDCVAAGYPQPTVAWRRQQGKAWITLKTEERYTVASNGSLIIRPSDLDDSGSYECRASNGMTNDLVRTISLTVHVAARFEDKLSVHTVRLAETAKLTCAAVGDHPTTITWTFNRQTITQHESSRYEIFEHISDKETISNLNIHDVDRGDNGMYTCVAKNSYGKDEKKVKLTVLEVPSAPSNVQVEQTWSESASVRWSAPYDGNSRITQYIVQYWKDSGTSHRLEEATISPTQNTVTLHDLHPGTTYIVRVLAINEVGRGNPSENHQFQTKEAAPSSPPTDVSVDAKGAGALKIKWKAPPRDQWNGQLKGYYVGYKIHEQADPYTYKTVDFSKTLEEEYRLSGLKKSTEYAIVVQVFNIAGTSPPSHEIVVKTSERDPPASPYLWVESQSRSTISIKWDHKTSKEQTIHYVLFYKEDMGTWTELAIPSSSQNQYTLNNLREGTRYQVYLRANSEAGQSDPSEILTVKTEGGALSDSSSHPIHERENETPVYLRESVIVPVGISLAVVVFVIIGAFIYVRREERKYRAALASVTDKRYPYGGNHTLPHMSSQRYVDVDKSRPLIRSPLPPPPSASDPYPTYPAPYATLPLRGGTLDRRRFSEDQQRAAFVAQHTLDRKRSIGHVIQETAEVHHYDVAS